jgi:hypothetical protein
MAAGKTCGGDGVEQAIDASLTASSGFAVSRDTLAVRLTLPHARRVEDLHLQVSARCRTHKRKRGRMAPFSSSYNAALRATAVAEAPAAKLRRRSEFDECDKLYQQRKHEQRNEPENPPKRVS